MSEPVGYPSESLISRVIALEGKVLVFESRERVLSEALLDYILADLAEPWVPAARRLEAVLVARMKK